MVDAGPRERRQTAVRDAIEPGLESARRLDVEALVARVAEGAHAAEQQREVADEEPRCDAEVQALETLRCAHSTTSSTRQKSRPSRPLELTSSSSGAVFPLSRGVAN